MADQHHRSRLTRHGVRQRPNIVIGSQAQLHGNAFMGTKLFRADRCRLLRSQFTAVANLVDFHALPRCPGRHLFDGCSTRPTQGPIRIDGLGNCFAVLDQVESPRPVDLGEESRSSAQSC